MKLKIIHLFSVAFALYCFPAEGQIIRKTYFPETPAGGQGTIDYILDHKKVNDGIILAVQRSTANTGDPVLLKLNPAGKVVWQCYNSAVSGSQSCSSFRFKLFKDSIIYGISVQTKSNIVYNTFWKVNAVTGELLFNKILYAADFSGVDIADYDSASFLVAYQYQSNATVALIHKATGDTILTKNFGSGGYLNVAADHNGNIYFSRDNTIFKFSRGNLSYPVWQRVYNETGKILDAIHVLYVDDFDDIYLFGRDGGSFGAGSGILTRVNSSSGLIDWYTAVAGSDVVVSDYADYGGYLFATYRDAFVGGVDDAFTTAKVDKSTGTRAWTSYLKATSLGSPNLQDGGAGQAALSLDNDCKGDIYLTGYYGAANYGPGAWDIMKIKNGDGSKIFDLTITQDSATNDYLSAGIISAVFGDTADFIGQLQLAKGGTALMFVQVDASSGKVLARNPLADSYLSISRTLDITNSNDTIYAFKQQGKFLVVEQYDPKSNLLWRKEFYHGADLLQGGQMKVVGNAVYFTASHVNADSYSEDTAVKADKLILYGLSKSDGSMLFSDTSFFSPAYIKPFELEGDNDAAYVFYFNRKAVYCIKGNSKGFSTSTTIETAGKILTFNGRLDIVQDQGGTLLYFGTGKIYSIDKSSLSKTSVLNYLNPRDYFGHVQLKDTAYVCGDDSSGNQLISAFNIKNFEPLWEKTYLGSGALYYLVSNDSNLIYAAGTSNSATTIHQVSVYTGKKNWTYHPDSVSYPVTFPYDLKIHPSHKYLAVAESNINPGGGTDALIELLDLKGKSLFSYTDKDEVGAKSRASAIVVLKDSVWIGGAFNRKSYPLQGFIYAVYEPKINYCTNTTSTLSINSCGKFVSPSGKYTWQASGQYSDTIKNAAGCDSIMSIHLKIDTITTAVSQSGKTLTAAMTGASYQWLDCNHGYSAIPGATGRSYTASKSGNYAVRIANGSCIDTSSCFNVTVNGIAAFEAENSISIYPNPTSSNVFIDCSSIDEGIMNIKVLSMVGEELQSKEIYKVSGNFNERLNLSSLPEGIYFIEINFKGQIIMKKICITR